MDPNAEVPKPLEQAYSRLLFPPSYVVVGVYRLLTDRTLLKPAWDKCRHGVARGAVVGIVWTGLTFNIQKKIIELFYMKSPTVTGLSHAGFFGYQLPISVPTYAAIFFIGQQLTTIMTFFLSRNIRVARERVYAQTVASRGKPADWWGPYVEEWERPPQVTVSTSKRWTLDQILGSFVGRLILRNLIIAPLSIYIPVIGILISAWIRAVGTARYLHKPYFEAKKMNAQQIATFVEERKWEYRAFGFTASVLEGLPIVGLVFNVANRVGAAMWAHDLEKNQHYVKEKLTSGSSGKATAISNSTSASSGLRARDGAKGLPSAYAEGLAEDVPGGL